MTLVKRFPIMLLFLLLLPLTAGANGVDHRGAVESRPAGTVIGTWVIGGVSFEVDATTEIEESNGALIVGQCAEVEYTVVSTTNVAQALKSEDECDGENGSDTEHQGMVESRPDGTTIGTWVIGGISFEINAATEIEYDDGMLTVGACAEVEYDGRSGTNIALELSSDDDCNGGGDNDADVYGLVESFPAGLVGTWTVAGVSYEATATTVFKQEDGPFAVGACVEVEYDPATNTAYEIKTDDDCFGGGDDDDQYSTVYGTVDSFPVGLIGDWTVAGVLYAADASTRFDQEDGAFANGGCVEVNYIAATLAALEIESAEAYHCGGGDGGHQGNDTDVYGLVESFPAGLIGDWTIGGVTYTAGVGTQFEQEDGSFAVGSCVEVKYLTTTHIALEIETEDSYHCGGNGGNAGSYSQVVGSIDSFPAGLIGDWVIDGVTFSADATTLFKQEDGAFAVGACVEIEYQTANSLALEIETEDPYHCGNATTPPDDDSSALGVNHTSGANGSNFVFTGNDFPADSVVKVMVDGVERGTALTNSAGWVTFAVETSTSGSTRAAATNEVSIAVNGQASNVQTVTTDAGQPQHNLPSNYSASSFRVANSPSAVALSSVSAGFTPQLMLLVALLLLAAASVPALPKLRL